MVKQISDMKPRRKPENKQPPIVAEVIRDVPVKKKQPLTPKQSKLVKGIVAGKSKRQAATDAGYTGSPATVSVTASKVLKNANVQDALATALTKHDLTPDRIAAVVSDALGAVKVSIIGNGDQAMADVQPDHAVRLRAADMAGKFMGIGKEDEKQADRGGNTFIFNQQNNHGVTGLGNFMK